MQEQIYIEKYKMINYLKKNGLSLKKVLSNLFNEDIKNITYLGFFGINKIPEYRFSLLKYNVVLKNFSNYSVFIKLIDKHKEKESLFCYWLFCKECFSLNTKSYEPKANIVNYKCENYEHKYELQIFGNNKRICKNSLVNIIDLQGYSKSNLKQMNRCNIGDLNKYLFVAIL